MTEAEPIGQAAYSASHSLSDNSKVDRSRLPKTCCRKLGSIPGPEDVVIDHERGRAYVSSQIRRGGSRRHINGSILVLDLTADNIKPICLTGELETELGYFHPHGIDLLIDKHGRRRLFVINHRTQTHHCIDIFDVEGVGKASEHLLYAGRISDDHYLTSPNDLVAVAPDEFYVVNDHGWRGKMAQGFESALLLAGIGMGTLIHAKLTGTGAIFSQIADGLSLPVGIETAPRSDPTLLYVAAAEIKAILVYRRMDDAKGLAWRPNGSISLDAAPDNLSWDAPEKGGELWVAGHPDMLALTLHLLQLQKSAPSKVFHIRNPDGQNPHVDLIFSDDGQLLSASSVAALYRRKHSGSSNKETVRVLIGAPQDEHILVCDAPEEALG